MAPSSLHARSSRRAVVPAALFVAGAVVSFIGSWNVSLWTDEAASVSAADRSLGGLWQLIQGQDAVHALYYVFLHAWTSIAGFSPVALRLPSAVAAGIAVVGVWALARALQRPEAAVWAAAVAIVLPRITWMGVEARSFGPSAAIAVWATVVLVRALESGRWRWVVYGVLVALGVALNIYLALLVVAHAVSLLLLRDTSWRTRGAWLIAAAAGALAASPVVLESMRQSAQLGDNAIGLSTMLRQAVVNQFFLGDTPTGNGGSDSGRSAWAVAAVVLAALCWALAAWACVRDGRSGARASGAARSAILRPVIVAVPIAIVPTVVAIAYSVAVSPLYNARYFTFAAPAVALLVGLGLEQLGPRLGRGSRVLRFAALVAVIALAAPVYVSQRQVTGKSGTDWSAAAAIVGDRAAQGDGIYFSPLEANRQAVVKRSERYVDTVYPADFDGLVDLTLRTTGAQDHTLRGTSWQIGGARASERLSRVDRVWVLRPADYGAAASAADDAVLRTAGFTRTAVWDGSRTDVLEFSRG